MKKKGIILALLCICTIHIMAQQPKTVVFKVRKKINSEVIRENVRQEEPAFIVVEENATYNGGDLGTFRNWVQSNLVYPQQASTNRIEGRVFIQFAVNSKGDVCNIKVLRSSGNPLLDNEANRVIKTSPKWKAARQSGSPVKQQFTVPITFKLLQ